MEETVNTSYNQSAEQQNNSMPSVASSQKINPIYLAIFIALVFLVLIFTLNYFNIFPISTLFPNQFGWLPNKERAVNDIADKKSPQVQSTITPTGYIRFPYNTQKADKILKDYVTDNIKDTFVPSTIEVKQNLLPTGELKGTDYQFGANWTSGDDTFHAAIHYIKNTNDLKDAEIFIKPLDAQKTPVNQNNSVVLTNKYLKNIPESLNFDCGTFEETISFCEHFTINDAGKSGFGISEGGGDSSSKVLFVFSCFFPKNDSYYTKRTSCLLFKEKDPSSL